MRADTQASPDDIDITQLWRELRRHGVKLMLTSVAVAGLTFGVLSLMTPRYTSEAQIAVIAKGAGASFADPAREGSGSDLAALRMDKEAVNTHVKALMSPDLAAKVADELKLAERKEFNSALGSEDFIEEILRLFAMSGPRPGESTDDRVLSVFLSKLDVYAPKESRFIGVRFTSSDPQLAADIANKLVETYLASLAQNRAAATDEAQVALEPRIAELSIDLANAEAEVERFRGEANIFKGGPQSTGLNEQQLGELTAELTRASAARSEAEARAKSAREMVREGSAEAQPDVQKSPLIQNLVQQRVRAERQMAELSATLLPAHPRMKQLQADLAGLKRQIAVEVDKVVEGLEKEAKVAALREEEVGKSIELLKKSVVEAGGDEVKLRSLEATAKAKRAELERLQAQFEAHKARTGVTDSAAEAQIVTRARAAGMPSFPRRGPFAALVMLAVLLFGTALIITNGLLKGARMQRRSFDQPVKDPARVPPLSVDPMVPPAAEDAASAQREPQLAPSITSVPELVRHLSRCKHGAAGYRVLISSDDPSVDPAQEALALSRRLAQTDTSVILIDWSRDGSGIAQQIGLPTMPGFTELLAGRATFEQVVRRLPESAVHFIPSGGPAAAQGVIDPDFLNMLLDALDEAYDQIIIAGRTEPARILFHTVEGRFDAGIAIVNATSASSQQSASADRFLGFAVTEIEIVRFVRSQTGARVRAMAAERSNLAVSHEAQPG